MTHDDQRDRRELLHRGGTWLYGAQWQAELARMLGPQHPDGPREALPRQMVQRWASGSRSIPDWVLAAIRTKIQARMQEAPSLLEDFARETCAIDATSTGK